MFKHVMYLAKGELVYCGPPKNSIQAFEQVSGAIQYVDKRLQRLHAFTPGLATAPHAGNQT